MKLSNVKLNLRWSNDRNRFYAPDLNRWVPWSNFRCHAEVAIGLWLPVGNINLSCRVSLSFQAARVGFHHEKKGPSAESQYYVYARKLYKWLCMEIMSRTEFNAFQYLFPSGYNIFRSIKSCRKTFVRDLYLYYGSLIWIDRSSEKSLR